MLLMLLILIFLGYIGYMKLVFIADISMLYLDANSWKIWRKCCRSAVETKGL
jgi:hypothetical protein